MWVSYILLAIILTWPTVNQITSHLPGDGGDDPAIAWNLWWVKYALLNIGQNPFASDFMFYPIGLNLAFYTLTVLNALTALPFTLTLGVVPASNLHMLFTFVAGGYGTFLLARYVLARLKLPPNSLTWLSATIAGGMYVFTSSKLFYVALGQFNIASTHWIPFAVLYLLKAHHQPIRLKNAGLVGLFLTLQAWAEMTYASFLLVFVGLYWLYWLGANLFQRNIQGRLLLPHLKNTAIALAIFSVGISPILIQMLPDMQTEGDFLVEGGGFAATFSADLWGYLIPTMHHPLFGDFINQTGIQDFTKGQHIYLGFMVMGLVIITAVVGYRRPLVGFWLMATAVFALLALGPVITINGNPTGLTGPFVIFQYLPLFKGNRYPSRYSVMMMLSASVLAAYALAYIGQWIAQKKQPKTMGYLVLLSLGGLFLFEHLTVPLPQSNMQLPPAYQTIAADTDDFTVLDIPFAWRNGFRITGALTTQFMFGQFYQTQHQKPLLQGNTSRNPAFKFQYFSQAPLISSLLALETGKTLPPEQWQRDQTIAAGVLAFFDIKYIIIRPYHYPHHTGSEVITVTHEATIPYIETVLSVEKIYDEADTRIYQVVDSALPTEVLIDSDSPLAPLYFGEGWGLISPGHPVAAQRTKTRLLLPLSPPNTTITLQMRLPEWATSQSQSVQLTLNGWQSEPQVLTTNGQTYSFSPPAEAVEPGLNEVWLHFDTVLEMPLPEEQLLDITALSAGDDVGKFGHIYLNGYEQSPNLRGYNVVAVQPDDTIEAKNFDTHLDAATSEAMAHYLNTLDPQATLVLAVADEASRNLSESAGAALQSKGASQTVQGCFRCSHALIVSPTTSLIETHSTYLPVGITTNLGLTESSLAALLDWIELRP